MTVRELIVGLLDMPMDAVVQVWNAVEVDCKSITGLSSEQPPYGLAYVYLNT